MTFHIAFHCYGMEGSFVSPYLSLNAAVCGAICLASRLQDTEHAFILLSLAVQVCQLPSFSIQFSNWRMEFFFSKIPGFRTLSGALRRPSLHAGGLRSFRPVRRPLLSLRFIRPNCRHPVLSADLHGQRGLSALLCLGSKIQGQHSRSLGRGYDLNS